MIDIKAIYTVPSLKHAFFIMSSFEGSYNKYELLKESKKRMEYFEHILLMKGNIRPKDIPQWTLKVMNEGEFLLALAQQDPTGTISTSLSFENHKTLEQLVINTTKNLPNSSELTLKTPKFLSVIPDEDIIEVFI